MAIMMKPTVEDIRRKTGIPARSIQERANISAATWRKMKLKIEPVSHDSLMRVLRVLNAELGSNYEPSDIDCLIGR